MYRSLLLAAIVGWGITATQASYANGPADTVVESEQVLSELMAIPGKQIPHRLLEEAQGIAIIPNVIKIGFVAGARRGHGVVMVRDHDGEWSLPQFITLTGGSVGWQAGIQGTDVVLIFTTKPRREPMRHCSPKSFLIRAVVVFSSVHPSKERHSKSTMMPMSFITGRRPVLSHGVSRRRPPICVTFWPNSLQKPRSCR